MSPPEEMAADGSASERELSPLEEDVKPDLSTMSSELMTEQRASTAGPDQVGRAESNGSVSEDATPIKPSSSISNGKPNMKDPSRPRRKKARRACFACQRAHLTCGDERPCQRCIKRGLQDACTDGVRKKAKYLHDAPAEALIPPGMGGYHHLNGTKAATSESSKPDVPITTGSLAQAASYYAQPQHSDLYSPVPQHGMPPPLPTSVGGLSFSGNQTPMSTAYQHGQPTPPMGGLTPTMQQNSSHMQRYDNALFDPSDPALFNLDITNLNFGNHYGALEFGMLDQMSSAAYHQDHSDMMGNGLGHATQHFNPQFPDGSSAPFNQDAILQVDWNSNNPRHPSGAGIVATPNNTPVVPHLERHDSHALPQGYAIAAGGPASLASASPSSDPQDPPIQLDHDTPSALFMNPSQAPSQHPSPTFTKPALPTHSHAQAVQPPDGLGLNPRKRPYDADFIYESVTSAYSYTSGFHRLLNFIQKRFPTEKRIRIAKALAAVRPSLITWSQNLTNSDLIFMEVSVQRKTLEYLDFISAYGTPTIIARRDGTVIAASKEFMILTGWSKNILLGKEANLNANTGGLVTTQPTSGLNSATRTRQHSTEMDRNDIGTGTNNPGFAKDATAAPPPSPAASPQPVVIPELLDQDSVVEFYEDYAKLAFGDSTGHAIRRGKLLKYRTEKQMAALASATTNGSSDISSISGSQSPRRDDVSNHHVRQSSTGSGTDTGIQNEAGINRLGEKEGMVDCMYIWSIRRDIFEVPMLIVLNFLPIF